MEPQHNSSQQSTENTHSLTTQMPAHAAPKIGKIEKQSLSITPIFFNKFQQGCNNNKRNVARDKIDPEPYTTMKTSTDHDPDIIEISYHPYMDQNGQKRTHKPIEYIDISSPFSAENSPNETIQTEKEKMIQMEDEEMKNDEGNSTKNPYIFKKVKQKISHNNNYNKMAKQNHQQAILQQAHNYCSTTSQHNNNLHSNSRGKFPNWLSKEGTKKHALSKSILPSLISQSKLNAFPISNNATKNTKGITPGIYLADQNILSSKESRDYDKFTILYKDKIIKKEEKEEQPTKMAIKIMANTKYKGMSKRFYTPNAPMYSSLFVPTAPLPLGLKHPTDYITTNGKQENPIIKAINNMNQEAIRTEIHKNFRAKFPNNIPNLQGEDIMDKQIDNIHILNDQQLECQGAIIIPFANIEENASSPLYAGAFEVQKPNQPKMWICKPCDAIVFRKSNFRAHHKSEKHAENLKIWSEKLPHVPKSMRKGEQIHEKDSYKPSLIDLEHTMISIESIIPTKYHSQTAAMVSIFFNKYLDKQEAVDLIQDFKEAQEPTVPDQDKRHWINKKFEFLKKKKDPRSYMKHKWETRTVMIRRTTAQKKEVKPIADLARILFATLIDCKFIHINYIIFLAVIMNTRRLLNYPKSAIHLANGFYVDLFLSPKSIINYQHYRNPTHQNTNSIESPDLKELFIKEDSEDIMLGKCNPEEDKDFQNLLELEPIIPDLHEQINNDRYSPISQLNPEWTLEETFPNLNSADFSSSDSIPSLEINYQKQEVKKNTTNTIYVSNLRQGITKEQLYNLFSSCGYIEDIIKENFKSAEAIIIFDQCVAADKAVSTLKNTTFYGLIINVQRAQKRESLNEIRTWNEELISEDEVTQTGTREECTKEFHQEFSSSLNSSSSSSSSIPSSSSPAQNLSKTINLKGQVPPDIDTTMFEMNRFNNESLQIVSTQDMILLPYTTTPFEARIITNKDQNFNILEGKVSLTCGVAPFIQIIDGIYQVRDSILTPSIRNNSSIIIHIYKNKIIQGTTCHLKKDTIKGIKTNQEEWPTFHLQSKTFHFMNHLNQTSYQWNGENCLVEETNPWMMDIDNQEI